MTLREQYIKGIEAMGGKLVKHTHKYAVYTHPLHTDPSPYYVYIGRSGGLRVGRTIASSVPVGDKGKAHIIKQGEGK